MRVNMARSRENMEAGVAGGWALKREKGQKLGQRGKLGDRDNQSGLIDLYKDTGLTRSEMEKPLHGLSGGMTWSDLHFKRITLLFLWEQTARERRLKTEKVVRMPLRAVNQVGDDAGLDPNSSSEIGERWSNSECILKVNQLRRSNGLGGNVGGKVRRD